MTQAAIDVATPAKAGEREDWTAQAEAEAEKQAEIKSRVQQMRHDLKALAEERREVEAERSAALVDGEPASGYRARLRKIEQQAEDLEAEIAELEAAAGSWDARIKAARIKAAQARQAQVSEEAPEAVRELVSAIETVTAAVERVEALRKEHYNLGRIIRQRTDAKGGGPGARGANWSHRYWTRFVKAVEEIQRFEINVPE